MQWTQPLNDLTSHNILSLFHLIGCVITFSNIDESSLQIQMAINMLDQLHFSLCRNQLFCNQENFRNEKENLQRIKYIIYFIPTYTVQSLVQNPVGHLRQSFSAKIVNGLKLSTIFAKTSTVDFCMGSKYYGCIILFLFIIIQNLTKFQCRVHIGSSFTYSQPYQLPNNLLLRECQGIL